MVGAAALLASFSARVPFLPQRYCGTIAASCLCEGIEGYLVMTTVSPVQR
jgi:hypothetical protein